MGSDHARLRDGGVYGLGDVAAEVVGVADREVGVDPAFDLDTEGAPSTGRGHGYDQPRQ